MKDFYQGTEGLCLAAGNICHYLEDAHAHQSDEDPSLWPIRGYDDKERPICPFGYGLTSNGFDEGHRRHKWTCEKACQQGIPPRVAITGTTYPPPECPFQDPKHQHGKGGQRG